MSGEDNYQRVVEALRTRGKTPQQRDDEHLADIIEKQEQIIAAYKEAVATFKDKLANRDEAIATLEKMVRMDLETIDRMVARARDAA